MRKSESIQANKDMVAAPGDATCPCNASLLSLAENHLADPLSKLLK